MSNESAKKAADGTHPLLCIGNLQSDDDPVETSRVKLMVKGLSGVSFEADGSDIRAGLMPDLGKRLRYQAVVVATPTSSAPPRLVGILDGPPEGIIQFHELLGAGSIGDEKRGDLMAGFTKAPFYGAAYDKRSVVKGAVLPSRAAAQPSVEYVSGLLKDLVAGIAKDMLAANQHEIGKLNAKLAAMTDGDEATDLHALKERKVNKGFAINRVLVHSGEYFVAYPNEPECSTLATGRLLHVLLRGAGEPLALGRARHRHRLLLIVIVLDAILAVVANVTLETLRDTSALAAVRVAVGIARRRRAAS